MSAAPGNAEAYYLDTSVLLHVVYADSPAAVRWFAEREPLTMLSSVLLRLEAVRALRRDGLPPKAADAHLSHVALCSVDPDVMQYAEQIPYPLRSLDAIHLGTLMAVSPTLTLASHDANMLAVAAKLGLRTVDPLAP
ncbi:MAG: type II toxin-antitoxin system VapC family toxin [Bifidobacteriaceae bacterium]|nr:type II toxin-antitoxin system VapC family toxin [Bifidobacteriaceae bacterium]